MGDLREDLESLLTRPVEATREVDWPELRLGAVPDDAADLAEVTEFLKLVDASLGPAEERAAARGLRAAAARLELLACLRERAAPPADAPPLFAVGSPCGAGIGKVVEEVGEALQVVGKLLGTGGGAAHWDGTDLRVRLAAELADAAAACRFVMGRQRIDGLDVESCVSAEYDRQETQRLHEARRTVGATESDGLDSVLDFVERAARLLEACRERARYAAENQVEDGRLAQLLALPPAGGGLGGEARTAAVRATYHLFAVARSLAANAYVVVERCGLDAAAFKARVEGKLRTFEAWHEAASARGGR